ncbi:hypothetical protein RYX36_031373, partial [Vicia faba]
YEVAISSITNRGANRIRSSPFTPTNPINLALPATEFSILKLPLESPPFSVQIDDNLSDLGIKNKKRPL